MRGEKTDSEPDPPATGAARDPSDRDTRGCAVTRLIFPERDRRAAGVDVLP